MLAVLTVNSDADDLIAGDGFVTLREAILAANFNFATDLGDVGDPAPLPDTIVFDPTLDGSTIMLDPFLGSLPVIVEDLTIDAGSLTLGLTIDGGDGLDLLPGTFDGFTVLIVAGPAPVVDVEFIGLSITGGDALGAGGGILNFGDLTVTQCNVFGNASGLFGGGIDSDAVLTVVESTITGNMAAVAGGGIYAFGGDVTIENSTVSNNASGGDGGGLGRGPFAPGLFLTVTGSTFFGNTAAGDGGGIWVMSPGGLSTTITNSTISGNEALDDGGGVALFTGFFDTATIEHSTITDNEADADGDGFGAGGGIFSVGPALLALDHTIVGENFAVGDVAGAAVATFSLIGFDPFGAVVDVVGNLIGVAGPIDPMLAPLSNNGGPTLTHRLLPGSPAIDSGDPLFPAPPVIDQRGAPFLREAAPTFLIDKGAYELRSFGGPIPLVVSTLRDENDGNYAPGDLSLREAIGLANGNLGFSDVMTFAPTLSGGTIVLSNLFGELDITDGVTIDASALPAGVTIDAGNGADGLPGTGDGMRIFNIEDLVAAPTIDVELVGLTLTGGDVMGGAGSGGGAILNQETLDLVDCVVIGNATSGAFADGGGIASTGPLTVTDSTISLNSTSGADADGGGIFNSGSLIIAGSTISDNTTSGASAAGGGIANFGPLTVTDSTISGNSTSGAAAYGGGLHNIGSLTVAGSAISANTTSGMMSFGGGIASLGTASVSDSTISENSTTGLAIGGGMWVEGSLSVTGSTVAGNTTLGDGGGISMGGTGTLTINSSTVSGNVAFGGSGGGISTNTTSTILAIDSSTISGNMAAVYGGGIFLRVPAGAPATINRSTITGNFAGEVGGGINVLMFGTRTLTLNHTIVAGNGDGTGFGPDVSQFIPGLGILTASYSLIGNSAGSAPVNVGGTSLIGTAAAPIDPMLGPLADNGGPTMTHAPLAGSPAIDAGDPAAVAGAGGVLMFDQRGEGFTRVYDDTIDIGALESQPIIVPPVPPALPGDYNLDGVVDTADFLWWQKTYGASVPAYSGADGDGDGMIDDDDYDVWLENFGEALPAAGGGGAQEAPADQGYSATLESSLVASSVGADVQPTVHVKVEELPTSMPKRLAVRSEFALVTSASPAYRDDALMAWLALYTAEPDRELQSVDAGLFVVANITDEEELFPEVDAAFASVGSGSDFQWERH